MTTDKQAWNARLTPDCYATIRALADHYTITRGPTTLTAVVEQAVRELARAEHVKPARKHYTER